ncbi:MAG: C1 family peptidase [Methanobrevibacter sp.]|nr:C1 family peptidase [Methanobrevibacter sp.]
MKFYRMSIIFLFLLMISIGAACAEDASQAVQDNLDTSDSEVMADAPDGTYSDLSDKINSNQSSIELEKNYKFNNQTDTGKEYLNINHKTITIDGKGKAIDANNKAGLFKIENSSEVTIKNLIIRNCLNSSIWLSASKLTTDNVTFENNYDIGGGAALYAYRNSTYTSSGDKFLDNTATSGAAIFASSSKVFLDNSLFRNTNPVQWALIYGYSSTIDITNSIFANTTSKYATAVYNTYNTYIKKSKFHNLCADITAGAVAVKGNSLTDTQIIDCEFVNVTSSKNGGALFIDAYGDADGNVSGSVLINNTLFENCSSEFGGAMLQLGGSAEINDSIFINNNASENGGAIYTSNVMLTVNKSNFTDNKAGLDSGLGGAIFFDYSSLAVDNSRFNDNSASEGGAIFIYDSNYTIAKSSFENNGEDVRSYFDGPVSSISDCGELKAYLNSSKSEFMVRYGGISFTLNPTVIKDASASDSHFDLRDYGLVTPVRNQGSMGSCWAFGAAGAFESAFLKATGISLDISENNIQNMGLRYSIYGHSKNTEAGTYYTSTAYFLSWLGAINASDDAYDELGKISSLSFSGDAYRIVDAVFVDVTDRNAVKEALIKYGALNLFVYGANNMDSSYDDDYKSVYNSKYDGNHYVTLVGWNDTFSKDQFSTTPAGDGAWICKNSWGTGWGDDGYFYLSYYDHSLNESEAVGFIIENVDYEKLYQVEVGGLSEFNDKYTEYEDAFVSQDGDIIAAVGTYFEKANTPYTISIYVSGNLVYTQEGIANRAGYSTIKLNKFIAVENNTVFSVRIKSSSTPILSQTRQQLLENNSYVIQDGGRYFLSDSVAPIKVYTYHNSLITKNIVKYYDGKELIFTVENATDAVAIGFEGINRTINIVDGKGNVCLGVLKVGNYEVTVYHGNQTFKNYITVKSTINTGGVTAVTVAYNTELTIATEFLNIDGEPLANASVGVKFDGEPVNLKTNGEGSLDIIIYDGNAIGKHVLDLTNPANNEIMTITITIVSRFAGNANVNMYYYDGHSYKVRVKDNMGNFAGKNQLVAIKIGKKSFNVKTDANGWATLKIPDTITPGKYTIAATYYGQTVENSLVVKQVLKLSKVKVKKSAKKLVLKATLKQANKALKSKKVTFKFNGKKYTAKTDKKGVAKVTIKKNVLKKLKVGKKVKYQVTYLKNTVKTSVKVKR